MSDRQTILVIDDDPGVTAALAELLDGRGRTLLLCADVESAELVLAQRPVTHVLSDVQFSGPFGFEGLQFLARVQVQRPSCRIVLMSGLTSEALHATAVDRGAAAVLAKPFELAELTDALQLDPHGEGDYEVHRVAALDELLRGGLLTTAFQPIVTLDRQVFGFEALTRLRDPWPGGGVTELFEYASKRQQLPELNLAAIECALAQAPALPPGTMLFVNIDPATFERAKLVDVLRSAALRNHVPLARVVLEITERSGFRDANVALRALDELRALGVHYALDDQGSAYSHLALVDRIRPSFIKISQAFGTAFDEDATRTRVVRHIVDLAHDLGCRTILEGIETATTARAAAGQGIDLAQGFLYGRPHEASHWREGLSEAS